MTSAESTTGRFIASAPEPLSHPHRLLWVVAILALLGSCSARSNDDSGTAAANGRINELEDELSSQKADLSAVRGDVDQMKAIITDMCASSRWRRVADRPAACDTSP